MDYGKIFSTALKYGFNAKRIGIFFILLLPIFGSVIFGLSTFMQAASNPAALSLVGVMTSILVLLVVVGIVMLVSIYVKGLISADASSYWKSKKRISLCNSKPSMKGRYLSILGATIIIGFIVGIINQIPFIGWLISIVLSWMFLFYLQSIVLGKKGAIDSIKESYYIFMDNKLEVFLFWLLLTIIGGVIMFIALIPLIIAALPILMPIISAIMTNDITALSGIVQLIQQNLMTIGIGGLVTIAIMSYLTLFQEAAKVFFYNSVKKKRIK